MAKVKLTTKMGSGASTDMPRFMRKPGMSQMGYTLPKNVGSNMMTKGKSSPGKNPKVAIPKMRTVLGGISKRSLKIRGGK